LVSASLINEEAPARTDTLSQKLINNYFMAIGGLDRFLTIYSIQKDGILKEGKNVYMISQWQLEPNYFLEERTLNKGNTKTEILKGYNGTVAWTYEPTEKTALPVVLKAEEREELLRNADFYGSFYEHSQRGIIFEYRGTATSKGRKQYLVKGYFPDKQAVYYYFDAKTFLVTRLGTTRMIQGNRVEHDLYIDQYYLVNGIWMPKKISYGYGKEIYGELTWSDFEVNTEMDKSIFNLPEPNEIWLRSKAK